MSAPLAVAGLAQFEEMIVARDLPTAERLLADTAPQALAACVTRRAQVTSRQTRGTEADCLSFQD